MPPTPPHPTRTWAGLKPWKVLIPDTVGPCSHLCTEMGLQRPLGTKALCPLAGTFTCHGPGDEVKATGPFTLEHEEDRWQSLCVSVRKRTGPQLTQGQVQCGAQQRSAVGRTRDKGGESEDTLPFPEANPTLSFAHLSPPGECPCLPPGGLGKSRCEEDTADIPRRRGWGGGASQFPGRTGAVGHT